GVGLQRAVGERALRIGEGDLAGKPARHVGVDELRRRVVGPPGGEIFAHVFSSHMHYNTSREVCMAKRRRPPKAGDLDGFLKRLGERVRTMRSRRGMSRKVLARHSKVSERYLAQLEAGAGNCSIVLLRRIAHAMSVPVAELVDDRPDRPVENLLLAQFI